MAGKKTGAKPRSPAAAVETRKGPPADGKADASNPRRATVREPAQRVSPARPRERTWKRSNLSRSTGQPGPWLPEGLPEKFRGQILSSFQEELRRIAAKDPTRADQLARSLDTLPLNSSHHSPTTLGAEITSDARVELDELRNAALTILGLMDRLMCSPAARDAVLLHEQEFAQELIRQARAYRSRSHIWSQRARAALLSKELSKLGVTASTPRDTAIEMLDQFCHRHGLLDSPNLDAKSRARTLARAQKALSGGKPSNRGPRKGQQRALLVLLNQEGLGEKNIAKTESLSSFEIGRLLSRSNIEQVDSVTTVAAAESRVIEVARYIVLGSAIDNGIDVQPLLDDSRGPIDIELGLRLRARRQTPK